MQVDQFSLPKRAKLSSFGSSGILSNSSSIQLDVDAEAGDAKDDNTRSKNNVNLWIFLEVNLIDSESELVRLVAIWVEIPQR